MCGSTNIGGSKTITLMPGTYIITNCTSSLCGGNTNSGQLQLGGSSATLTGTDVTLVFTGTLNNNALQASGNVNLTAPTTAQTMLRTRA